MKAWADAVARLDIQCPECRSIADRIVRGESLLYEEKHHIEQHVTRTREALCSRRRTPRAMLAGVRDGWRDVLKKNSPHKGKN